MKVLNFPLSKITLFFVLGLLTAHYIYLTHNVSGIVLLFSILYFTTTYYNSKNNLLQKVNFGIATLIFSFVLGITTHIVHSELTRRSNYIHNVVSENESHTIEVSLKEKLKSSAYSDRYIASVTNIDGKFATGKLLLNISEDSAKHTFAIGSRLQINTKIVRHKSNKNPHQFDYGNYLTKKSILAQSYCSISDIKISTNIDKNIYYYAAQIRNRIINNLRASGMNAAELNVAVALILGQQQDISPEILRDYQYAGAVHILSVSGLHVGYLLVFINFILMRLPRTRAGNISRFVIIFAVLWCFAVLAGLSPSVIRSVTMFTFVAAGMCLNRDNNIFHTLLVSLLLILVVSPSFLFDVGFQLSYVSLFFIVWVQPMLSKLWLPKNKLMQYFWNIITVSVAAQIGAMPLSIYYFHQFPGLFFITNLIILPAIGFIMGIGIFIMIIALISNVPVFLIKILEFSIWLINFIIAKIASLEQFIIQDIPMNIMLSVSLYMLFTAIILWFERPKFQRIILVLGAIILVQISFFRTFYLVETNNETIVLNIRKNSMIIEKNGNKATVFYDKNTFKNGYNNKILQSYLTANFINRSNKFALNNVHYFNGKKLFVIDSFAVFPPDLAADIILLTKSPKINLERFIYANKPKVIVADGSNYKLYVKLWSQTCAKRKIPFHATAEKGFYKIE